MEETKNNNEEILTTDMGISSNPVPVSNPEPLIVPGITPTPEVKPIEEVVTQEVTSISEQTTFPEVGPIPVVMPTEEVISQEAVPVPVVPTEEVTSQEVVPTPVVAEAAPEISQQTAFPEVAPVVMPTEEVISQEVLPTPVVTEAAPEALQTTAFPEVAPAPVVMPTAEVTSQEVVPTPVMPTEEINQSPQTTPEPEKKSSVLKVILMILLILAIMSGGYYVYKEYFAKPVDKDDAEVLEKGDNKEQEKEVVPEQLNGIYKKDDGEDQILLFQNSEKEGSLIFAEEVDVAGVKSLSYPIQLKSLEINANTMLYKEETNEILKIEKTDNKVVVTYLGKEDNKEKYENIIGSYTKTKEATSYSVEEFKK